MAAEMKPLQGFAEQRGLVPCATTHMAMGEALDDMSGATSPQAMAALLEGITIANMSMSGRFSETVPLSTLGIFNRSCGMTTYKTRAL